MKRGFILLVLVTLLSGCSTYAATRYSISADNVVALRALNAKVNLGAFTSFQPGVSEIMCRGVGPIKTPDGEPFSEYIRKALLDELRIADAYSPSSPVTLTGNLDEIDFSSNSGSWTLALTVTPSSGNPMRFQEDYPFTSSFYGETACNQTAQALMPAVQNLIGKIVRSSDFASTVSQ